MPKEAAELAGKPVEGLDYCPKCGAAFVPFLRGQVQRWPRWFLIGPRRPYCALICWTCKEIVGYE